MMCISKYFRLVHHITFKLYTVSKSYHLKRICFPLQDTDGKHGLFLSLIKRQAMAERLHYINQLRTQLEGKG